MATTDAKRRERVASVFRNGRNQAVRIPVEFSFDTDEVTIERRGEALILRPRYRHGWDRFFDDPDLRLPEEFEAPADLPPQERESP